MITWLVDDFFHLHPIFHIILSAILLLTISFGYVSDVRSYMRFKYGC